jgi:hypothetical protein
VYVTVCEFASEGSVHYARVNLDMAIIPFATAVESLAAVRAGTTRLAIRGLLFATITAGILRMLIVTSSSTLHQGAKNQSRQHIDCWFRIVTQINHTFADIAPDVIIEETVFVEANRARLVTEVLGHSVHIDVERVSKLYLGIAREADFVVQFLQRLSKVRTDHAAESHHGGPKQAEMIAGTSIRRPCPRSVFLDVAREN